MAISTHCRTASAHVRTWTFVANRADWLEAPLFWQSRTREIEDKLSDALHERLTQRFIDRRTSVLMKRLAQKEELMSTVEEDGAIHVEGEYVGPHQGISLHSRWRGDGANGKTREGGVAEGGGSRDRRARPGRRRLSRSRSHRSRASARSSGRMPPIAQLEAGASLLKPRITILADDQLTGPDREAVQARLEKFLEPPHRQQSSSRWSSSKKAKALTGTSRGIAFRLVETLGVLPRDQVAAGSQEPDPGRARRLAQVRRALRRLQYLRAAAPQARRHANCACCSGRLEKSKDGKFDLETLPAAAGPGPDLGCLRPLDAARLLRRLRLSHLRHRASCASTCWSASPT